jgi:ribonucleoside-triphosphate reductase
MFHLPLISHTNIHGDLLMLQPTTVMKRDGKTAVPFDRKKIEIAISKAAASSGESVDAVKITDLVLYDIQNEFDSSNVITIEDIQNFVERALMYARHYGTAKKYIIYRQHREDVRNLSDSALINLVKEYLGKEEWSIKENSNMGYSLQGLNHYVAAKAMSLYWLNEIYSPDARAAHVDGFLHIHDLNLLAPYCCGWDIKQVLLVGFGGVEGANDAGPAKHFDVALGQCWNFLFTMQGEAAGAQAFSNFDTYLAPFIRYDGLTYKEVKQKLQQFFHNMTTKTRVGFQCVPDTYTCLTPEGWKSHDELRIGDPIYVFDKDTGEIRLDVLTRVNVYDYSGKMINFHGRKLNILTTPDHRTIRRKFNSSSYVIETSGDIYQKYRTPIDIPLAGRVNRRGVDMTNDEIRLLGWALTDCHMDLRSSRLRIYQSPKKYAHEVANLLIRLDADWYANTAGGGGYGDEVYRFDVKGDYAKKILEYTGGNREAIPLDFINHASVEQIEILLETMIHADGHIEPNGRIRIGKKNDYMAECIQSLLVLSGYGSKRNRQLSCTDTVTVYKKSHASVTSDVVDFDGVVWCPTTDTGTFICKAENGVPFITGNCPFTNVSMDLTVPSYMKNEPVIHGGQFHDSDTYGDFQEEMDMFNRAFCEVMLKGDASGRQFSFPIPNYNITKEFNWDNENLDALWMLAAKYGAPYFTNFVNSDLNPEDIRSMCPLHPDEKISIKMNGNWLIMDISSIHHHLINRCDPDGHYVNGDGYYVRLNGKEIPVTGVVAVSPDGFVTVKTAYDPDGVTFENNHQQPRMYLKKNTEGKHELTDMRTYSADTLEVGAFVPYSITGRDLSTLPKGAFVHGEFIMVPITKIEKQKKTAPYAYCISVGSDDHLFELKEGGMVTHNCHLQLDNNELRQRSGGIFNANPMTGSVGVVTQNLPLFAYLAKGDESKFFEYLDKYMHIAKELLEDKRTFVEQQTKLGLYPFSKVYLQDSFARHGEYFHNHFSTIGLVGGNEACLNLFGEPITTERGKAFAEKVLRFMRDKCDQFKQETGYLYNLEATPAEGVCYRLAKLNSKKYPDIITASSKILGAEPFYTNSTQVPVDYSDDIIEVFEHQDGLQTIYTGGTVLHVLLGEAIKDHNVVKNLVKKLCTNYHIPYITISPDYSVCASHGYLPGKVDACPKCGCGAETYSRVVGFYTPVSRWNKGKAQESTMRNTYESIADKIKIPGIDTEE